MGLSSDLKEACTKRQNRKSLFAVVGEHTQYVHQLGAEGLQIARFDGNMALPEFQQTPFDGVAFFVDQVMDGFQQLDVPTSVQPLPGRAPPGFDLGKAGFPEPNHRNRNTDFLADFTDFVIELTLPRRWFGWGCAHRSPLFQCLDKNPGFNLD
jgi:hypothetical protein